MAVSFHPGAAFDLREAVAWYRERSPIAADRLIAEVERGVERIVERPNAWPLYWVGTRRFLLRTFPYSVIYTSDRDDVIIVAVAHAKRKPGYWDHRV